MRNSYKERGVSSSGRAPALQAGCGRFDSDTLHQGIRKDPFFCGPVVYRSGHQVFILVSGVRFPAGSPCRAVAQG